ncbi:MAG: MarR family 2-MHQ and catechol resistance regulon transcriptional repressor [Saprospiraceae bacterium]|jgi:MarR family 2-MHQ and catechol resistance regulon transcriptional repressor
MGIKEDINQEKFKSNAEMALVNILYTFNWLKDRQQVFLKEHNILTQHYNILRIVNGNKSNVVFPGQIKEVMIDRGRDLTRLIDKLVNLGLLQRQHCDSNRRMIEISITPKGRKVVKDLGEKLSKEMKSFFKLSEKEALQLSDLLDKLRG